MMKSMPDVPPRIVFENNPSEVLSWMIGKIIDEIDYDEACRVWEISGRTIDTMYKDVIKRRDRLIVLLSS